MTMCTDSVDGTSAAKDYKYDDDNDVELNVLGCRVGIFSRDS